MVPKNQKNDMQNGMAIKTESKAKKKNKGSSFVFTKIIDTPPVYDNTEYEKFSDNVED